jgi:hypothetical protein
MEAIAVPPTRIERAKLKVHNLAGPTYPRDEHAIGAAGAESIKAL